MYCERKSFPKTCSGTKILESKRRHADQRRKCASTLRSLHLGNRADDDDDDDDYDYDDVNNGFDNDD